MASIEWRNTGRVGAGPAGCLPARPAGGFPARPAGGFGVGVGQAGRLAALVVGLLALCLAAPALAHPVAQGALHVDIAVDRVTVRANVALEEAIVENAFGPAAQSAGSAADLRRNHAGYLLKHLRIYADGQRLTGHAAMRPVPSGAASAAAADRVSYDLTYVRPAGARPAGARPPRYPRALRLEQDVLNEFEFAPGNRWEATYVVSIAERGQPQVAALLLTSREPLLYRTRADGAARTTPLAAPQVDRWRLSADYLRHGVLHILTGYDHLLFITALVLATVTLWDLVKIITAFTLAHTLTLTLAVLNIVRLSTQIVEPLIAASIVVVALDNVLRPQRSRGGGRLLIAFLFGLFHGLGFAGGLLDAMDDMAGLTVGLAILTFSIGVELGHQLVVLPLFTALRLTDRMRPAGPDRTPAHAVVMRYGSLLIAAAGGVYLVAALR